MKATCKTSDLANGCKYCVKNFAVKKEGYKCFPVQSDGWNKD